MKKLSFILLVLVTGPAVAQYREGEPPVLSRAEAADPTAGYADVIANFKRRYESAKQPRVVLFWNRELTDRLAQTVVQKSVTTGSSSESASAVGGDAAKRAEKLASSSQTTINSTEVLDGNSRGEVLDPRTDSLLKSTFLTALQNGGVRFVDRTMAVRSTAATQGGAVDSQYVEMKALKDKAEWLLEIVPVRDSKAVLGYAFKVSLKDIRSESLITELYTPALPPFRESNTWVAVSGGSGFAKAAAAAPTTREVGYTLAVEIMGQIADSL